MKYLATIAGTAALAAVMGFSGQHAAANPGDSVSGGGQILDNTSDAKISFGIWANELAGSVFEGEVQNNFHRTTGQLPLKSKFHGNDVTEINFYNSDDASCNAAFNMTVNGTLDGEPGYSVIVRGGDAGSPGNTNSAEPFDTARIQLFDAPDAGGTEIYDTHDVDFDDESSCVGTARTGLDRGNITIEYP